MPLLDHFSEVVSLSAADPRNLGSKLRSVYRIHDVYESERLQSGPPQTTVSGQKDFGSPLLSLVPFSNRVAGVGSFLASFSGVRSPDGVM